MHPASCLFSWERRHCSAPAVASVHSLLSCAHLRLPACRSLMLYRVYRLSTRRNLANTKLKFLITIQPDLRFPILHQPIASEFRSLSRYGASEPP